ncbi:MAG: oligosaccharide flippase family protein [bacterium]|nr:oligosaccharide flippase family protein [bacterium]
MSRLSKNIIYNLFGKGLLLVLGFVAVKYIFKRLGEDALGIIYFTYMMNAMLTAVLNMGICSTTIHEVSAHLESEPEYIKDLIRTFSLFYWGVYALVGVALFFMAPILVEKWINLKTMDPSTAIYILRILGIASFAALPTSFYASLFSGLQRMEFNNFIDVITTGLQQFGTILILVLGGNLLHVVYWFAACYGLRVVIYLAVSGYFFPVRALVPGYSAGIVKRNWNFASRMISVSVFTTIYTQIDKVIISKLLPIGILGYYSFAQGTVSKGTLLADSISQAAFPSFSAMFKKGDRTELISQYRKLQDTICFIGVLIFAVISFALLPLFAYILNEETARMLLLPGILLCVAGLLNATLRIPGVFALAVGRPGIDARQSLYALFVVPPVTIFLIYSLGLTGAALSVVFCYLFIYFYSVRRICRECIEIPVWEWYRHILKVFVLAGLTYGAAGIVLSITGIFSISSLVLAYTCASIAFIAGAFLMIGQELQSTLYRFRKVLKEKIGGFINE